ncbi:uncharacterized protein LOC134222885 [Armigeres subalbatus]|uniref:uncharacterized protein LOC134222885 n=1 Tax=Armigeres subalbatus TaxID=124917 RepID=UPI002ED0FDD7
MAKSKVAPLKYQSIPRLELQGALIGARLMNSVCESHTLKIDQKFLWTDSSTVLAWIRSEHRRYKQYVAHRVGEILTLSELENWRWVPSKENVADCLTKWTKDTEPSSSGRWLNGPSFLYHLEREWPEQRHPAETNEELRSHVLLHRVAIPKNLVDAGRISKWNVLVRTIAFVHRFISNCRRRLQGHPIETIRATAAQEKLLIKPIPAKLIPLCQQEYVKAEMFLWRAAQSESYPDEMRVLLNNWNKPTEELLNVEKSSSLYKLTPFVDEHGVIRMEGRTANAAYAAFDTRFPIILPIDHPITQRLIEHYHGQFGHANKETVVNELRQRYYIPCLRTTVDRISRNCRRCKVAKCRPQSPRMAPLPKQRLTPYLKPFSYVGIDYLGPLEVTVGRRREKRYIVVFTCLVVRAIHLELAYSLTTDSCIMAIRRFTCKWGSPVEIFTDNGTNFVGANRKLKEQIKMINDKCGETFTDARTKWSFNPPAAPHMGGVWERMVRSVKETMQALEDGHKLNDEILLTVLAETVDIINARPLTYMPQGPNECEALTPNHLLFGESARTHEEMREPVDLAEALRSSYKRSQFLSRIAWERWLKEYFPTVNKRSKWFEEAKHMKVGDLVYVAEGNRRS